MDILARPGSTALFLPVRLIFNSTSSTDIRTLYILLVLSFVDSTTSSSVKAAFLEQHRDAFTSIFKGLSQDSYSLVRRVLEVCWSGLWSDQKLKRTLKVQIFSEATLSQVSWFCLWHNWPPKERIFLARPHIRP